jgi:predicted SAM-dependent methyltransferase
MKLDIGCGLNYKKPFDEWTHLDANHADHVEIVCDFGKIDLPDGSVDEIWIGDVIEHIEPWRIREVLAEWHRILKPRGKIGGQTPNLMKTVQDYVSNGMTIREALVPRIYGWTDRPTEQHYVTFTQESLSKLFADNGFNVRDYSASPGHSECYWWFVFSGTKA